MQVACAGVFPKSGLELRKEWKDFEIRSFYKVEVPKDLPDLEKGCRCGAVLRGLALPTDCPLFGKACTPRHPLGRAWCPTKEHARYSTSTACCFDTKG